MEVPWQNDPFLSLIQECLDQLDQYKTKAVFCEMLIKLYELSPEMKTQYNEEIIRLFKMIRELNPSSEILVIRQKERIKRYLEKMLQGQPQKWEPQLHLVHPDSLVAVLIKQLLISIKKDGLVSAVQEYSKKAALLMNHEYLRKELLSVQIILNFYGWTSKGFRYLETMQSLIADLNFLLSTPI